MPRTSTAAMKTPRLSEVIRQLESVKRQHGDIEFWIQVHHAERPMNNGERNLRLAVQTIPPAEHPPVCVLQMDA